MKAVRIATVIFILLLAVVVLNSIYINKITEKFADRIAVIDTRDLKAARDELERINEEFKGIWYWY